MRAEVRSPPGAANDIVDVEARSYPVEGRVHDCASDGPTLAIATGAGITLVDTRQGATRALRAEGAQRVAVNAAWVAWADGAGVRAVPRSSRP